MATTAVTRTVVVDEELLENLAETAKQKRMAQAGTSAGTTAGTRKRLRPMAPQQAAPSSQTPYVVDLSNEPDSDPDEVLIVGEKAGTRRLAAPGPVYPRFGHQRNTNMALGSSAPSGRRHMATAGMAAPSWAQSLLPEAPVQPPIPAAPPSPERAGYKCPVCLDRCDDMSTTACGHVFCTGCIKECITKQKKCPKCRKSLRLNQIHRIYLND